MNFDTMTYEQKYAYLLKRMDELCAIYSLKNAPIYDRARINTLFDQELFFVSGYDINMYGRLQPLQDEMYKKTRILESEKYYDIIQPNKLAKKIKNNMDSYIDERMSNLLDMYDGKTISYGKSYNFMSILAKELLILSSDDASYKDRKMTEFVDRLQEIYNKKIKSNKGREYIPFFDEDFYAQNKAGEGGVFAPTVKKLISRSKVLCVYYICPDVKVNEYEDFVKAFSCECQFYEFKRVSTPNITQKLEFYHRFFMEKTRIDKLGINQKNVDKHYEECFSQLITQSDRYAEKRFDFYQKLLKNPQCPEDYLGIISSLQEMDAKFLLSPLEREEYNRKFKEITPACLKIRKDRIESHKNVNDNCQKTM